MPRILLTTSVERASPSTSSARISSGLPDCMTFSRSGSKSLTAGDLRVGDEDVGVLDDRLHALGVGDEVRRDVALVEAHPPVSSRSSPKVFDSSTVMTPSLPTLSIASAMISPTVVSAAEIEAVAAICSLVSMSMAMFDSCSETAMTAASMPRLRPIGFAPAATLRRPSLTIAWARTVAVVVPSPATSSVFLATSLTSSAPIFSYGSSSSISLAMLTPSLVMVGAPTSSRGRRCGPWDRE